MIKIELKLTPEQLYVIESALFNQKIEYERHVGVDDKTGFFIDGVNDITSVLNEIIRQRDEQWLR